MKIVYIVHRDPPHQALISGTVLKETSKLVYIQFNSKTYAYVKSKENQNKIVYKDNRKGFEYPWQNIK